MFDIASCLVVVFDLCHLFFTLLRLLCLHGVVPSVSVFILGVFVLIVLKRTSLQKDWPMTIPIRISTSNMSWVTSLSSLCFLLLYLMSWTLFLGFSRRSVVVPSPPLFIWSYSSGSEIYDSFLPSSSSNVFSSCSSV